MKKFLIFLIFAAAAQQAFPSSDFKFDNFGANVNANNIRAFTRDIGGLLGSGVYTTGRILGWGGFQLSGRAAVMPKPGKKNTALGTETSAMFFPWIQGEIGLPFRLDGFIRASSSSGLTIAGGGIKWGITRPTEILYTFQPMLAVMAQSGVHRDFSLTHYSANMVISFKLPYVVPYAGGGVDYTKLTVESAAAASLVGYRSYAATGRGTFGVNVKLPSYMDLSVAANYTNYGLGAEASFGVRF